MPTFVSKKQLRMMMAIVKGKSGMTTRGDSGPPLAIALKYSGKDDGLPESKGKELQGGLWGRKLTKNIVRAGQVDTAVHEMTHGDALKLVGTGLFKMLKGQVMGMGDDTIKDISIAGHTLHIRKHVNDVYSGSVEDGLKMIHQFTNKSLPSLTADLMSVFEWYSDEDVNFEDDIDDQVIHEGINKLVHNYHTANIADIYQEMEGIREEIRSGNAIDLQQSERKIMELFDKLEETIKNTQIKHNELAREAGKEIDGIRETLLQLQLSIDNKIEVPSKIQAVSAIPIHPNKVFNDYYSYISKPKVVIEPNGRITIEFASDWQTSEKENFLNDLKVKVLKKSKK